MLQYSAPYFFAPNVPDGITEADQAAAFSELKKVYEAVQEEKKAGKLGFARLPFDKDSLQAVQTLAQDLEGKFRQVVVIGIGGSDLGSRAAFRALCSPYFNLSEDVRGGKPQLFFCGDTTDPDALNQLLPVLRWSDTLLIMISKSGNTIEQMASFIYLRQQMVDALGVEEVKNHIVTITDGAKGTLREITNEEGYRNLVIPDDVGGRFSVLSTVGLFPLALVGVDIEQLRQGAADLDIAEGEEPSSAALFAWHQYLAFSRRGQHISVMFPYAYCLREFGQWYRQLWAESLGKRLNSQGEVVHTGPTPIAAIGPTDQHSQVQLYQEGPKDKIITFIRTKEPLTDITLPEAFPHKEGVRYLKGMSMHRILTAEQEGTAAALAQEGRPSVLLEIEKMDAYHVGQLFHFFALATAYAGHLWQVNVYDQPGVELGKNLIYKAIGREGF